MPLAGSPLFTREGRNHRVVLEDVGEPLNGSADGTHGHGGRYLALNFGTDIFRAYAITALDKAQDGMI